MSELLTAAQMREIERDAIDSGLVTGLELMERAGRGVVEAAFEEWPELAQTSHRAVVLCGPGNNGGDGFVVARLLKEWGWGVEVFLYGDPDKLPPDARVNHGRWTAMGEVRDWHDLDAGLPEAELFVDAVFGTGLTRPVPDAVSHPIVLARMHGARKARVVAVDLPSGLCADSGKMIAQAHRAASDLAVTFHLPKLGHVLQDGPRGCGKVVCKSIGLETGRHVLRVKHVDAEALSIEEIPRLSKSGQDHKYIHGHALILSGPPGAGGAARLAARGALRIGAGLVSVVCEKAAVAEHAAHLTAVMIRRADGAGALAALLQDDRLNAVCLGPGLGLARARELAPAALAERAGRHPAHRGVVLDADALTAHAEDPQVLFAMLHKRCVLTPHAGEFARLFPDIAERLAVAPTVGPAYSKVDATREAAQRAGCVVLFKGPDTVLAAPDGRCSIISAPNDRAVPWLATAGSGDVLAGFITGLLARGYEPMQAAEMAAWLHVECARSFGPGLIAEDIAEELPKVFRALGL